MDTNAWHFVVVSWRASDHTTRNRQCQALKFQLHKLNTSDIFGKTMRIESHWTIVVASYALTFVHRFFWWRTKRTYSTSGNGCLELRMNAIDARSDKVHINQYDHWGRVKIWLLLRCMRFSSHRRHKTGFESRMLSKHIMLTIRCRWRKYGLSYRNDMVFAQRKVMIFCDSKFDWHVKWSNDQSSSQSLGIFEERQKRGLAFPSLASWIKGASWKDSYSVRCSRSSKDCQRLASIRPESEYGQYWIPWRS